MVEQEKPLTLVHGYGFDEKGREKPDFRGRLTILAAQELMRRGIIGSVAITGGRQQVGEAELAEPMLKQMRRNNPHLSDRDTVVSPVPGGTIGELNEFKKITQNKNVGQLAVLATETHLGRIKRRLKGKFGKKASDIIVFSVEDVLARMVPSNRYQSLIETLQNSEDEEWFKRQEKTLEKIDKIPFGAQLIDFWSRFPYRFTLREAVKKPFRKNRRES